MSGHSARDYGGGLATKGAFDSLSACLMHLASSKAIFSTKISRNGPAPTCCKGKTHENPRGRGWGPRDDVQEVTLTEDDGFDEQVAAAAGVTEEDPNQEVLAQRAKEVRKKAWKHIEELRAAIQVPPSS